MGAENFKVGRDVAVTPGKVIHRRYQVMTKSSKDRYIDPESYLTAAPRREGSWWPEWVAWLAEHSGAPVGPPSTGAAKSVTGRSATLPEPMCLKSDIMPRQTITLAGEKGLVVVLARDHPQRRGAL
jgi:poly(3-hydroxyalkanoate) synthetase